MTAVSVASFLQAASHPAHNLRRFSYAKFGGRGGVVPRTPTFTDLQVTQRGAGANMSVDVAEGTCLVNGTESVYQGLYHGDNQGVQNVVITAANVTNPRRDMIVARIKDTEYGVAVTDTFSLEAIAGTPAGSPADPTIPDNCIVLARVAVAANATSITNANITDLRTGYTAVTGATAIGNQVKAAALGGVVVCTSSFRPTTSLYEGQLIWETDTNRLHRYSGSGWMCINGAATGFHGGGSTSSTYLAAIGLTLPAGNWTIAAKMEYADNSGTNGANNPTLQIWDATAGVELDHTEAYSAAAIQRFSMDSLATLSTTSTKSVHIRMKEATNGANKTFANVRGTAMATGSIS